MKTNEEFLAQVYDKYEKEQESRRRRKKHLRQAVTAAAACLLLVAVAVNNEGLVSLTAHLTGEHERNAVDGAAPPATEGIEPGGQAADGLPEDLTDSAPEDDGLTGYYCLPRICISSATADEDSAEEMPGQMFRTGDLETVEKALAALSEAGCVTKTEKAQENWQAEYDYQVEIERMPQQFEFYYITGEVDWHEILEQDNAGESGGEKE